MNGCAMRCRIPLEWLSTWRGGASGTGQELDLSIYDVSAPLPPPSRNSATGRRLYRWKYRGIFDTGDASLIRRDSGTRRVLASRLMLIAVLRSFRPLRTHRFCRHSYSFDAALAVCMYILYNCVRWPLLSTGETVTGQLADAIGDFACFVFLFGSICETASCPVRDLSSPRVDQSARCPVRELAIRELSTVQLPVKRTAKYARGGHGLSQPMGWVRLGLGLILSRFLMGSVAASPIFTARAMLALQALYQLQQFRVSVCPSVRPSVRYAPELCQNNGT